MPLPTNDSWSLSMATPFPTIVNGNQIGPMIAYRNYQTRLSLVPPIGYLDQSDIVFCTESPLLFVLLLLQPLVTDGKDNAIVLFSLVLECQSLVWKIDI